MLINKLVNAMASFALLLMAWTSDQAYFKRLGPVLVTSKCSSLDFFCMIWDLTLEGPSWEVFSHSGLLIIHVLVMLWVQIK